MKVSHRRYGMIWRLYQLAALLALSLVSQPATAQTILAFGDSLTVGYQLRPGEGFAPQLEKALRAKGRDVSVVNAGVSGDTTVQGKARIAWGLAGLKVKPDLVIVELGANDMLRGQSPGLAKANLDAIIKDFKGRGIPVLLAGMKAQPNLGPGYVKQFDAIYPALAASNKVPLYPFFMDGVAAVPGMQLGDGLHPTPKGVQVIVGKMLPIVLRELDRLPKLALTTK